MADTDNDPTKFSENIVKEDTRSVKGDSESKTNTLHEKEDGQSVEEKHDDASTKDEEAGVDTRADQIIPDVEVIPTVNHAPTVPPRSKTANALIVLALCMAVWLAALDTVIVTPALPTIAEDFNVSDSGFAWIAGCYLIPNASSMPFWGKISDIFGRKPILLVVNVIFMVGSLIAALSDSLGQLLAGRAIQGLGAGGLISLANIVISDLYSLRERPIYYSLIGATWAFAMTLAPVVGGAFVQNVTWKWCFWISCASIPPNLVKFKANMYKYHAMLSQSFS